MRNTERGIRHLLFNKQLFDSPRENQMGTTQFVMVYFNILKGDAVAISTAKRLNDRLFAAQKPDARS